MAILRHATAATAILVSASGLQVMTPWGSNESFCMGGRRVPQLYLLGAQKAGTTTVSGDFFAAGIESACRNPVFTKECHLFDEVCGFHNGRTRTVAEWNGEALSGVCPSDDSAKATWTRNFKRRCEDTKASLIDMTPVNLRLPGLPATLEAWYGKDKSRLGFIVALRDPVQRMYSGYYQDLDRGRFLLPNDTSADHATFEDYASMAMQRASGRLAAGESSELARDYKVDQLFRSMYHHNLKPWLTHFDPRQFVLVPMMRYFVSLKARREVVNAVRTQFGADASAEQVVIGRQRNSRAHPSLTEVTSKGVANELRRFFEQDTILLAKDLVWGIRRDLVLSGYKGDGSQDSVHKYLVENW